MISFIIICVIAYYLSPIILLVTVLAALAWLFIKLAPIVVGWVVLFILLRFLLTLLFGSNQSPESAKKDEEALATFAFCLSTAITITVVLIYFDKIF